jgi:hypothetical protein
VVRRFVLVLVLVVATGSARADAPRSPTAALAASGIGTAVASGLVLAGFFTAPTGQDFNLPVMYAGLGVAAVAPSLGEFYAGVPLTYGLAARVFGAGLATVALTTQMKTVTCDDATMATQTCTNMQGAGYALMGLAAIAFIGGMAYDVSDAPDAVDRWNAKWFPTVTPVVLATPAGTMPGVGLSGYF